MLRQGALSVSRHAVVARSSTARVFSTSLRSMAEGDAGSARSGGAAQGDAFTKREQASEDYYVRQQEQEKLKQLRKKLKDQQQNISDLQKDIDNMLGEKDQK